MISLASENTRLLLTTWNLPGNQRTLWFPLQNMALQQAQTELDRVLLANGVVSLPALFTWSRGCQSQFTPTSTLMDNSSPPRLSSHFSSNQESGQGCWVSLHHTSRQTRIWPCYSHHSFPVPLFMILKQTGLDHKRKTTKVNLKNTFIQIVLTYMSD